MVREATLSSWEDVRWFLAVVRAGSFSGAARTLGTDQSTVSRRIALLERALGQPLFERGPRTVRRTTQAEALLEPALAVERAALALEDTARRAEAEPRGLVRIALTEGLAQHVVVPRLLPAFFDAHPEITVHLRTGDEVTDLARHEADVSVRFFRPARGELVGRRVARLPLAVLVARRARRRWARRALADLPWTAYVKDDLETPESRMLKALGVSRTRLACSSLETQIAAVRAGLGVAIAPRALTNALPDLAALDHDDVPDLGALDLFVVTRPALRKVPRVAVVYDALVRTLQELDAGGET